MSEPSSPGVPGEPSVQPPREAEIATPARGVPQQPAPDQPVATQAQVWGDGPAPRASQEDHRASRVRVLQVIALVVGLIGTGWVSTDYFRTVWRDVKPDDPVAVEAGGVAQLEGLTVSLVEATDLGETPSLQGSDWQPPAGFHAWRVVLDSESTNEDLFACDVALVDAAGREFVANYFVESFADGYEWSYSCGPPDPDGDVPPQQALLVLLPADAQPQTVQITSTAFTASYIQLDIG